MPRLRKKPPVGPNVNPEIGQEVETIATAVPDLSPVNMIADHYLSGKEITRGSVELFRQLVLASVALSGAGLYIVPAKMYADNRGKEYAGTTKAWQETSYIVGTTAPALAFLYNATIHFIHYRSLDQVPEALKHLLNVPLTKAQRNMQDAGVGIGAGLSAVPLVIVSFAYPITSNVIGKYAFGIIVLIDNTVLHFLPIKLAMMDWKYRIPFLPFQLLIQKIIECLKSNNQELSERVSLVAPDVADAESVAIQQAVLQYLQQVQQEIEASYKFNLRTLSFQPSFMQQWRETSIEQSHLKRLTTVFPPLPQTSQSLVGNDQSSWRQKLDTGARYIFGAIGAIAIPLSAAAYEMGPANYFYELTGSYAATGAIVFFPLYFLNVLLVYAGKFNGERFYDFLTKWGPNDSKIPFQAKLYPKLFIALMALNVWLNLYSYASAEELVHDNFKDPFWDDVRPTLVWFARIGIPALGLSAMYDFYCVVLKSWATYFGGEGSRIAARLMTELDQLQHAIRIAKPSTLKNSASYLTTLGIFKPDLEQASAVPVSLSPLPHQTAATQNSSSWVDYVNPMNLYRKFTSPPATQAETRGLLARESVNDGVSIEPQTSEYGTMQGQGQHTHGVG